MAQSKQIPDSRINWPAAYTPVSARVFAQNSLDIAASPEVVWSFLIDCLRWPTWYKHCAKVSILRGGSLLGPDSQFRFKTLDLYFEPEIEIFEPHRLLLWSAKGPAGTSGAHAWLLVPTEAGCRVITEEAQKGALLVLFGARTRRRLLVAHQDWLEALKALAEAA